MAELLHSSPAVDVISSI